MLRTLAPLLAVVSLIYPLLTFMGAWYSWEYLLKNYSSPEPPTNKQKRQQARMELLFYLLIPFMGLILIGYGIYRLARYLSHLIHDCFLKDEEPLDINRGPYR